MTYVEKSIVLQTVDHLWREHIVNLDHLRSVVGFRGYAQRDPLQEYKAEAFELFQAMLANLRQAVTAQLMRVELVREAAERRRRPSRNAWHHIDGTTGEDDFGGGTRWRLLAENRVGRGSPANPRGTAIPGNEPVHLGPP
jgi:preprotein translocase subunit SecA